MRFLLLCGFVCLLMFSLAKCDEVESDVDDVMENIFATRDEVPEKRGLADPKKKDADDQCGFGFWCLQKRKF